MQDSAIAAEPASFRVRIAAMLYESLLVLAVLFIASLPFLYVVGDAQRGWRHVAFQIYLVGLLFLYFATFWRRSGQTLAMKTWRIRLVAPDGGRITLKLAAQRYALAWISLVAGGGGFWWALLDRDRQFLHDRLLGTRLVRVPRSS